MRPNELAGRMGKIPEAISKFASDKFNAMLSEFLLNRIDKIPVDGKDYIPEIKQLLESGHRVVIAPPHWSVIDVSILVFFAKVLDRTIVGPKSVKFSDGRMGALGPIAEALEGLNVKLEPVVQAQSGPKVNTGINITAWRKILDGFSLSKILGIFFQGTRSRTIGACQVPKEVIGMFDNFFSKRKDIFVVPACLVGAYQFWPAHKNIPDTSKFSQLRIKICKPRSIEEMMKLAENLGCSITEATFIPALAELSGECWGVYEPIVIEYIISQFEQITPSEPN